MKRMFGEEIKMKYYEVFIYNVLYIKMDKRKSYNQFLYFFVFINEVFVHMNKKIVQKMSMNLVDKFMRFRNNFYIIVCPQNPMNNTSE